MGSHRRKLAPKPLVCSGSLPEGTEFHGIFPINKQKANHQWIMQKVDGKYADKTMKLVLIPVNKIDEATMDAKNTEAATLIGSGTCADTASGTTMTPASGGSCFNLQVDDSKDESLWPIDTSGISTGLVIAAEHVPTEFEDTKHYLKDAENTDIEPFATEGGYWVQMTCDIQNKKVSVFEECTNSGCADSCKTKRELTLTNNKACYQVKHGEGFELMTVTCTEANGKVTAKLDIRDKASSDMTCASDLSSVQVEETHSHESGVCEMDGHGHDAHSHRRKLAPRALNCDTTTTSSVDNLRTSGASDQVIKALVVLFATALSTFIMTDF